MKRLSQKFAKVDNGTVFKNYSNLNEKEFKLFCYIVSELQVKNRLADKSDRDVYYLEGEEKEIDDVNVVEIPVSKKFHEIYNTHITLKEVKKIVAGVQSMVISITKENEIIFVNPFEAKISLKPLTVTIKVKEEIVDYIVYLKNNWLTIYTDELKEITGKFMTGLYLKYRQYENTGFVRMKVDDAKIYFGCGEDYQTKTLVNRLKMYTEKFNAKFKEKGVQLELTFERNESTRKVTHIFIKINK